MDSAGAVSPLGVTLLVGIVVGLAVGASLFIDRVGEEVEPESVAEREARSRVRDGVYEVGLASGAPVEISTGDGFVRLIIDGSPIDVPLSWWEDHIGPTWDVGEWICIAGPGAGCYAPDATAMEAAVIADGAILADLGPVADFNEEDQPVVSYQGRRPSFFIESDGGIRVQCTTDISLDVIGVEITDGKNGPDIPVYMRHSMTGAAPFDDIFSGQAVSGDDNHDFGIVQEGAVLGIWANANNGGFDEEYTSFESDPHVLVLKDGDEGPEFTPYGNQVAISELLEPYVDEQGYITLAPGEAMILVEFNPNLNSEAADFQDLVVVYEFGVAEC